MELEEKLSKLGYSIMYGGDFIMGNKRLHDYNFRLSITVVNERVDDYYMADLVVRNQSDIDNIQTAYNILQSDLKELENEYKRI